jgi:hypothetical protein
MFEPFHPNYYSQMVQFSNPIYIPEAQDINFAQHQIIDNIIKGKVQSKWVNSYNPKLVSNKRVIKTIRAHFFLHWVWENYRLPIIYLIRHPMAVCASVLKYFERDPSWEPDLTPYLLNNHLMGQLSQHQRDQVISASSAFQMQIVTWCLRNFFALRQLGSIPHHLIFYEDVIADPVIEIEKVYKFLGISFSNKNVRMIENMAGTRFLDIENSEKSSLKKWQEAFSDKQKIQAEEYLRSFSLNQYYTVDNYFPVKSFAGAN